MQIDRGEYKLMHDRSPKWDVFRIM